MNNEPESNKPLETGTDGLIQAFDQLLEHHQELPAEPVQDASALPVYLSDSCPGVDAWLCLALGDAQESEKDALFAHAACCGPCAAQLQLSLRLLREDPTPAEASELAALECATPAWQQRLAAELAQTPFRRRPILLFRRPMWMAAVAATLLLAVALTSLWHYRNTPERLLAQAYSHDRAMEFRIPGAGFNAVSPRDHQRGASSASLSSWLLDASARIQQKLEKNPSDPHWLQMEARADVLEEKYDAAIDILDRLLAAGPVTAPLLTDDATAYYQRGLAAGSESDRTQALEYLRRADELSPDDPVILFNEAIALEDRGQVMNAVETWNRFLRFEHDQKWLAEGRQRLAHLEQKLSRLKTHESRLQKMATDPSTMRALAADPVQLASLDEELSVEWLPELLTRAYIAPADRSRGSPCADACLSARLLLQALAESLKNQHQDLWLSHLLSPSQISSPQFISAARDLAAGLESVRKAQYFISLDQLKRARQEFESSGNLAGADMAQTELGFAVFRIGDNHVPCYNAVHPMIGRRPEYAWIQIQARMQNQLCDTSPGIDAASRQTYQPILAMARQHHYVMLGLRLQNLLASPAVSAGEVERAWSIYSPALREFWNSDLTAYRLYTSLSGLSELESTTPRTRVSYLLQRELVNILSYSPAGEQIIPAERYDLVLAAIRAGAEAVAKQQMQLAQAELSQAPDRSFLQSRMGISYLRMASLYTDRKDYSQARQLLDTFRNIYKNELKGYLLWYAAASEAELELASGQPSDADELLQKSILHMERDARDKPTQYISWARRERDAYADEAGIWLTKNRPAEDILALWERYRMRILDQQIPACADNSLTCLTPKIAATRAQLKTDRLIGLIVLPERTLVYEVDQAGVHWSRIAVSKEEMITAATALERAVNTPQSSMATVNQASQRLGRLLFSNLHTPLKPGIALVLESDPVLGNLPWPVVQSPIGPLGLSVDLVESPSMAIDQAGAPLQARSNPSALPLLIGASWTGDASEPLPEVVNEVRDAARYYAHSDLLLARDATSARVLPRLATAPIIHIAGHASWYSSGAHIQLAPDKASYPGQDPETLAHLDSLTLRKHPPRAAQLVVLSACSSGKREEGWNNGLGDILDTLVGVGVPTVVATRWQIDSQSASQVMRLFYDQLAQGAFVPHALTSARQAIAADARYQHPYYWGAYYVYGTRPIYLNRLVRPATPPGIL